MDQRRPAPCSPAPSPKRPPLGLSEAPTEEDLGREAMEAKREGRGFDAKIDSPKVLVFVSLEYFQKNRADRFFISPGSFDLSPI